MLTLKTWDTGSIIFQSPSVRMWSVVWLGWGGVRLGGGSDSCFLLLLTQPWEVTESGEDSRVSAWAEYLGLCEMPEWGVRKEVNEGT